MTRRKLVILGLVAACATAGAIAVAARSDARPPLPRSTDSRNYIVYQNDRPDPPAPPVAAEAAALPGGGVRFAYIDVFIDTQNAALAAYQFELRDAVGVTKIVGLEGNADLPYQNPPFYDPAAMRGDRVIVAGYSATQPERHPTGRIRVARVHVMIDGDREPKYEAKLTAAAKADGSAIAATIQLSPGSAP